MNKMIISGAVLALLAISFNGCGSTTSTNGEEAKAKIDFAEYFEKSDQVINRVSIDSHTKEKTLNRDFYNVKVVVKDNIITYEVKDKVQRKVTITNDEVNLTYPESPSDNITRKRQIEIGEMLSYSSLERSFTTGGIKYESKKVKTCKLEAKINSFEIDPKLLDQKYAGDIIVEACTTTEEIFLGESNSTLTLVDTSRTYFQKGKGIITLVDDNCFIEKPILYINDNSKECAYRTSDVDALVE